MDVGEYAQPSEEHLTAPLRRLINRSEINIPKNSDESQIRYSDRETQRSAMLCSGPDRVNTTDQPQDRYSNNDGQISWKKLVKKVRKQHPPFFNEEDALSPFGSPLPHFGQLDTLFGKPNPVGPFSLLDVGKDLFSNSTGNDFGVRDHVKNFSSNAADSQSLNTTNKDNEQRCALEEWDKVKDKCNKNPVTAHGQTEEERLQQKGSWSIPDGNYNHLPHPDGSGNSFQDKDQRSKYQDVENKYQDEDRKYQDEEKTSSNMVMPLQDVVTLLKGFKGSTSQTGDDGSGLFVINEKSVDDNKLTQCDKSSGSSGVNSTTTTESVHAVAMDFTETECAAEKQEPLVDKEEKYGEMTSIEESVLEEDSHSTHKMDLTADERQVVDPTLTGDAHSRISANIAIMENIVSGSGEVADPNIVDNVSPGVLTNRTRLTVEDNRSGCNDECMSENIEPQNVDIMSERIESGNVENKEKNELHSTDTLSSDEKDAPNTSEKDKKTGEMTSDALGASKASCEEERIGEIISDALGASRTSSEENRIGEITADCDVQPEKLDADICKEMAKGDESEENRASSVETHGVISNEVSDVRQENNQTTLSNCEINLCKDTPQRGVCGNGDQITPEVSDKGSKPITSCKAANVLMMNEPGQDEMVTVNEGVKELNETRRINLGFLRVSNMQQSQITPPRGFITTDQLSDFDSPGKSAAMDSVGDGRMWGSAISGERDKADKGNLNMQISETPSASNLSISSHPPSHYMQGKDCYVSASSAQDLEKAKTCSGENVNVDQETCTLEYALSHPMRNDNITLESTSVKAALVGGGDGLQDDCSIAASGQTAVPPSCTWSEIVNFSTSPSLTTKSANNQLDNSWNSATTPSISNTQAPTASAPVVSEHESPVGELVQVVNDLFSAHPYVGLAESVNIGALLSSAKCLQDSADLLENLQKTPPAGSKSSSANKQLVTPPPKMSLLSPAKMSVTRIATDEEGEDQELSSSVITRMMMESLTGTPGNSTTPQSNTNGNGGGNQRQDLYSLPIEYSFGDSDNNFSVNLKTIKDSPMSASKDLEVSTQVCDEDFGNIATYICQEEGETAQILHITETGNVICNTLDCGARVAFPDQFASSDILQGADSKTPPSGLEAAHKGREKESNGSKKLNDKPPTRKRLKRHATKKQVCTCEDCMEYEKPKWSSESLRRGNNLSGKGIIVDGEVVPHIAMEVEILNDNQNSDQENAFVPPSIAESAKSSDADGSTHEESESMKGGPPGREVPKMSKVKKRRKGVSPKKKSVNKKDHKTKEKYQGRSTGKLKQPDSRTGRSKASKRKRNGSSVIISPGRLFTNISEEEEVQQAAEALTSLFSSDDVERSTEMMQGSPFKDNFTPPAGDAAVGNSTRTEVNVLSSDNVVLDSTVDGAIVALRDALSSSIEANLSEIKLRESMTTELSERENGSERSAKQQLEGDHEIKSDTQEKIKVKKKKVKKKKMKRGEKNRQVGDSKTKIKTACPPDDVCGLSKVVSKKSRSKAQFPRQEGCTNRSNLTAVHETETRFLCASTHKVKMLGVQDYSLTKPCSNKRVTQSRTTVISSVTEATKPSTIKQNVETSSSPKTQIQTPSESKCNDKAAANVTTNKSIEDKEETPANDMRTDEAMEEDSPTMASGSPSQPVLFEVKLQKDDSHPGPGGEDDNPRPITYLQATIENSESDHMDSGKKKCSSVEEPLQIRRASNKEMAEMIADFTKRLNGNLDSVAEEGSTSSNPVTGERDTDEKSTVVNDVPSNPVEPDEAEHSTSATTNSADIKKRKDINDLERIVSPSLMRKYTQIRQVSEKSRARRRKKFQQRRLESSMLHSTRNSQESKTVNKVDSKNLSGEHMLDGSTTRKEQLLDNQECRQGVGATRINEDGATPRRHDGATHRSEEDGATPKSEDDGATAKCAERKSEEWTCSLSSDVRVKPMVSSSLTDKDESEVVKTNTLMVGNNKETTEAQANKMGVQEHNDDDNISELSINSMGMDKQENETDVQEHSKEDVLELSLNNIETGNNGNKTGLRGHNNEDKVSELPVLNMETGNNWTKTGLQGHNNVVIVPDLPVQTMETGNKRNETSVQGDANEDSLSDLPIHEQRENSDNSGKFLQDAAQPSRLEVSTPTITTKNYSNRQDDTDKHREDEEPTTSEMFVSEAAPKSRHLNKADISANASMTAGKTKDRRSSPPASVVVELSDHVKRTDSTTEEEVVTSRTSRHFVEDPNKSTVFRSRVKSLRTQDCNDIRPEEARGMNDVHSPRKEKNWKYGGKKYAQNKTFNSRRERFRWRLQRSNSIISDTEDEEHHQMIQRTCTLRERGEQKGKQNKRRLMAKSSGGEDILVSDKDIAEMSEKSLKVILTDCRRQSQTSSSETRVSRHETEENSNCKIVDVLSENVVEQHLSVLHTRSGLGKVPMHHSSVKLPKTCEKRTLTSSQDDAQCLSYSVGQSRKWTRNLRRHSPLQENHSFSDEEFTKRSSLFNWSLRRGSSQMKRKVTYDDRSCDGDSECSEAEPPLKRLMVVPGSVYVSEMVADEKEEQHSGDNCKRKEELGQKPHKRPLLENSDPSNSDRQSVIEKVEHRKVDEGSKKTTGEESFEEKEKTDEESLVVRVSESDGCASIFNNDGGVELSPGKLSDTLQMIKEDKKNEPVVQLTSEAPSKLGLSEISDGDEVLAIEQTSCEHDSNPKCEEESVAQDNKKEECSTNIMQEKSASPTEKLSSTVNHTDADDQSDIGRVSCSPSEDTSLARSEQDIPIDKDIEDSESVQESSTVAKNMSVPSPHCKVINVSHSSVKMKSCVILLKRLDVSLFSGVKQMEGGGDEYDGETEMEDYLSSSDIQGASIKKHTDTPVSRDSHDSADDKENDKRRKRQRRVKKIKKSKDLKKQESPFGTSLKPESRKVTSEGPKELQLMEPDYSNKELSTTADCPHEEKPDKCMSSSLKYLSGDDVDSAGTIKKALLNEDSEENNIQSSVKKITGKIYTNDCHDGVENDDITICGDAKHKTVESEPTEKDNEVVNANKTSMPKENFSVLLKPLKHSVSQKIPDTSDSSTVDLRPPGHLSEVGRSHKRRKKKKKDKERKRRKTLPGLEDKNESDSGVNQLLCQDEQISDVSIRNCHLSDEDIKGDDNPEMRISPASGEVKPMNESQMEEDDFMVEPKQESRSDENDKPDKQLQDEGTFHDEDCLSITADSPDFFNDFGEEEEEDAVQESERIPETSEVVDSLEYEDVSSDGDSPIKERQPTEPVTLMPVKLMPKIPKKLTASISKQPNRVCRHGGESSPPPVTRKLLPNVPFIQFDKQSHPAMPVPASGERGEMVTEQQKQQPSSSGATSKQATEAGWQLTDTNKLAHKIPSGYCFQFAELGKCRYGKSCRYRHVLLKDIPSSRKVDTVSSGLLLRASPPLPYPPSLLDKVLDTPYGVTEEMKRSIQAIPPLSPFSEFQEPVDDPSCDLLSRRVRPRKSLDEGNPPLLPPPELPDFLETVEAPTVNEKNIKKRENLKAEGTQLKQRPENEENLTSRGQEKTESVAKPQAALNTLTDVNFEVTEPQVASNLSTDEIFEVKKQEVSPNPLTEERLEAEGTDKQDSTAQVMTAKKNEVTTVETNSSGIFDKKFRLVRNSKTAQKSPEKATSERDPFSDVRQLIKKRRASDAWNVYRLKVQQNECTPNLSLHLEIVSAFPSSISPFKWKDCKEALNEISRCFSVDTTQHVMEILKQLNGLYEEGSDDADDDLLSVAVDIFKHCVPHQQTFQGETCLLSKLSDHLFQESHFALLSVFVSKQAEKGFMPSLSSLENVLFKYHALNNHHEELLQIMRKLDKINMELPANVYDRVKKCLELSPYPDDCVEILRMKGRFHQLDPIEECLAVSQISDPNIQPSLLSVNNVDDDLVESHGNDDDIVCNLEAEKSGPTKSFTGTRLAISDTVQKAKDVKTLAELFLTIYKTDRIYLAETEIQACFSTGTVSVSPSKPHVMYRDFVEYISGENVLDKDGFIYLLSVGKELFLTMWRKKAVDIAWHVLETIFQMEYESILTVFVNLSLEKVVGRCPFNSFCCLVQCCLRTKNTFISHKLLLALQNNKWDHYFWDKTVKTQVWQHCYEDLANQLIISGYLEECLQLLVRVGESHFRIRKTPKGRRLMKEPFNLLLDEAYSRNDMALVNRIIQAIRKFSTFNEGHIHRLVTELVAREDKESLKQARDIYLEGLQEGAYLSHCVKDDLHEGRIQVTYSPEEIYLVLCEYFSQSDMYLNKMFSKKPPSWARSEVCNIFSLRDEDVCFRILVTVVGTPFENRNLQEAEHAIDSTIIKVVQKLGLLIPNFDTHVETMSLHEKVVVMKMDDIKKRYLSNHPKYAGGRGKR